ncbi:MAG: hypothetical protein AAB519_02130 [Patescibacteria group bacterium]
MEAFRKFFDTLNLPDKITGDFSLLLLFIGMSLGLGFLFGRFKLVSMLINVYISLAIISVIPEKFLEFSPYAPAGAFMALLLFLTMIDKRLFDLHISTAATDFFWRMFVMSILVTGMIVSSVLTFLPKKVALDLISVTAYSYFASPLAVVFWLVVPVLALLFINNRLK